MSGRRHGRVIVRALNRTQISDHRASVLTREAELGHVVVAAHEPLAQAACESVEVDPLVEVAKRRCSNALASVGLADGVALRAQPGRKNAAAALKRAQRGGVAGGLRQIPALRARPRYNFHFCNRHQKFLQHTRFAVIPAGYRAVERNSVQQLRSKRVAFLGQLGYQFRVFGFRPGSGSACPHVAF